MSKVVLHEYSLFDTFCQLELFEGERKLNQLFLHLTMILPFLQRILDLLRSGEIHTQIPSVAGLIDHGSKNDDAAVEVVAVGWRMPVADDRDEMDVAIGAVDDLPMKSVVQEGHSCSLLCLRYSLR